MHVIIFGAQGPVAIRNTIYGADNVFILIQSADAAAGGELSPVLRGGQDGAGHGERDRSAAGGPLRQPVGSNRRKGLKIAHSSFRTFGKNSPKGGQKPGEGEKRKIQKPVWLLDFSLAEAVGFEPTSP